MLGLNEKATAWVRRRHEGKDEWTRHAVGRCAWIRTEGRYLMVMEADGFVIAPGDLVARGEWDVEITGVGAGTEANVRAVLGQDAFRVEWVNAAESGIEAGRHVEVWGR